MDLPEAVDLIVIGTGLPESVVASAAARAGNSVLLLDSNSYYGSHWATLNLEDFMEWHEQHAQHGSTQKETLSSNASEVHVTEDRAVIRNISSSVIGHELTGEPRSYGIDLAHKAMQCTGPLVQAVRDLGLSNYMDFVHVQSSHMWTAGGLQGVPASKGGIFADSGLGMRDKRALMRFMQEVDRAITQGVRGTVFATDDFAGALETAGLPRHVQDMLLYAIVQAPGPVPGSGDGMLSGAAALRAIESYTSQVGTYVEGQAPYIDVAYGNSEIVQGFCRACAVKGGLTALRQRVATLLLADGRVTGVRTESGHVVRCSALAATASWLGAFRRPLHHLAADPAARAAALPRECEPRPGAHHQAEMSGASTESAQPVEGAVEGASVNSGAAGSSLDSAEVVARAVCLADAPVLAGTHNIQVVFPPGACGNPNTVFAWQCDPALHVCPPGKWLLYLAARAGGGTARQELEACLEALVDTPEARARADATATAGTADPRPQSEGSTSLHAAAASVEAGARESFEGDASPALARGEPRAAVSGRDSGDRDASARLSTPAPRGASGTPSSGVKPRACVACYYNQAVCNSAEFDLPENVAACSLPDETCTLDSALATAASAFSRLFPGVDFLHHAPVDQDLSDVSAQGAEEEEEDPLAAALKALE